MIQKGIIDGRPVDVITFNQFISQPNAYQVGFTAIDGENGYIYPIRSKTDGRPGFYPSPTICKYKEPTPEEQDAYSINNIIDFSKPNSVGHLISMQQQLQSQERTILTNADNVFQPQIKPDDYPAMVALKSAVNSKAIDLESYEHRFGPNFNNDKRLFEKPSITMAKLVSICKHLDIEAELTLRDAPGDIANPMGKEVTVNLTSIGGDEDV